MTGSEQWDPDLVFESCEINEIKEEVKSAKNSEKKDKIKKNPQVKK